MLVRAVLHRTAAALWLLLAGTVCTSPLAAADASAFTAAMESITARDAWRHAAALASDTFEGREGGTRGGRAAGAYILDHLRRHGYRPGGPDGEYEQPFGNGYRNILVLVPGSDPALRDEYVVIGAHYDHVGYGRADNSNGPLGYIHNGADDNASGTSGLLEVLEALSKLPQPPARSLLFAFWDAEELGLLGSEHWVNHPTVPLDRVRLLVNTDMIGRMSNETLEVSGFRTAAGLRQLICEQNSTVGLRLKFDWSIRSDSDHYPFFRRRIPFLMLHTGVHPDYHRPSDDVDRLNLEGLERVTRLLFAVAHAAANAQELPEFREKIHREGAEVRRQLEAVSVSPPPPGLRVGISWRRDDSEPGSVILSRVVPGSAAADAGLSVRDRIYAVNGRAFRSSAELRELLEQSPDGLAITAEREGRLRVVTLRLPAVAQASGEEDVDAR